MSLSLTQSIKDNEGFRGSPYKDTLDFETIGYGTKLPITKEEASLLLKHRLKSKITTLVEAKPFILELPNEIQNVLYEMAYQLGFYGVLKFKKMLEALKQREFKKASEEMLNSLWAKQTPNRAKQLAKKVKEYDKETGTKSC